ncbi:MAG: histidine--tRNA ligase [Acidobacteriota bacterium]
MAKRLQAVKGTRDLLPPETAIWAAVEATARRVFGLYGFGEIRTPMFEDTELFARGVGESSDIVGKEMYSFVDKGGRNVTLRPESTASVVRAYVEHGMHALPQPVKLFYIGPQFRYERPQKGRYRQFHQIGAEWIGATAAGSTGPDVEVVLMLWRFLSELGFGDLVVQINTVGDAESRRNYRQALVAYLEPFSEQLGEDSRRRLATNPLRILDSKSPAEQVLLEGAPKLADHLTEASRAHFRGVCAELQKAQVRTEVSPRLVRGLDYYTNTVFEIVSAGLGAQNAICGGGAYEGLVEELGGQSTYGVGFAIGEDRLVDVLPAASRARLMPTGSVVLRTLGDSPELADLAAALAEELRAAGIPVVGLGPETPAKTYAHADHLGSPAILVLGEDELASNTVTVRTTADRAQRAVDRSNLVPYLKSLLWSVSKEEKS